jgi:hypothetical protein
MGTLPLGGSLVISRIACGIGVARQKLHGLSTAGRGEGLP